MVALTIGNVIITVDHWLKSELISAVAEQQNYNNLSVVTALASPYGVIYFLHTKDQARSLSARGHVCIDLLWHTIMLEIIAGIKKCDFHNLCDFSYKCDF